MNNLKEMDGFISNTSKYLVKLSRYNIEEVFHNNINQLDFNYTLEDTYSIYNESNTLIGFIDFCIIENEDEVYAHISSLEIFDDYRWVGYGTQVINLIKDFCNCDIKGYSKPDDSAVNFWANNNAEFSSCDDCEFCDDCAGSLGCDEPLDFVFTIKNT